MQGLYALLSVGVMMCFLAHLLLALGTFIGLLFADHHPEENVLTSSFVANGQPGFPLGVDFISPFVFLISPALWYIPFKLFSDALKGADQPDK